MDTGHPAPSKRVRPGGSDLTQSWRLDRNARQLFDRRQAGGDLRQAVVPQRPHALADRGALDLLAARFRNGQALDGLAHLEQLVDADPPLVACLAAARTAALAIEGHPVRGGGDL